MKRDLANLYVCPNTKKPLWLETTEDDSKSAVDNGRFVSDEGIEYKIEEGIPFFIFPGQLSRKEIETQEWYDVSAPKFYQAAMEWQFASFDEDEDRVRELMVDRLELDPQARVLEVGSGTGMDSFRIARRLNDRGAFFTQDLSPRMVEFTRDRLQRDVEGHSIACEIEQFVSSADRLPFPDDCFDAVFHFGGFNNFNRPKEAFAEFARVTKQGGRVLTGDEGVAPWLRDTEFAEIVITNNPLFEHQAPIDHLPESAREVTVEWILANSFYLISFRVGDGPPEIDLDLPHQGRRGGTMRSRYFGQLEGVNVETKKLAWEAAAKSGTSMHEWLDRLVREAAERELKD